MANGEELNKAPTEAVGIPNAVPSGPANGISSRYQRFQQILDRAAGNSTATYGGLGARFWKTLGIPELLDARLEGMRLIAPENEPTHSCCASKSEPQPVASRADRSALIAGLRGLPPFDGSGFPRLMWGGSAVSEDDIQFIADWINDGLPATARGAEIQNIEAAIGTIAIEREEFAVFEGSPNQYKFQRGELKQRMNIDCLPPTHLEQLRCAFREMYDLNNWPQDVRSYNNMALIHQNHCQHGWERFLPWHRVYLYEFEQALQDHCPDVTMPYWDWVMPEYPKAVIPDALKMFLTENSLTFLGAHHPTIPADPLKKLEDMVGQPFATLSSFFEAAAKRIGSEYTVGGYRERFIDALLEANSLWYPLRYPGQFGENGSSTINAEIHYHYPSPTDIQQIMSLRTFRDFGGGSLYNDSFGFLDQNPHNTMHIWTGGQNPFQEPKSLEDRNKAANLKNRKFHQRSDMYQEQPFGDMFSNLTASYDPIFWSVHANVDRLWSEWQVNHPDAVPADLDSALSPWTYTIRDTLDMSRFGYEYVKSSYVLPVGLGSPVGRFVSRPLDIPDAVRAGFQQAEVRLHRVPQLPRSCFVRVFLNLPFANAKTPLNDEHYGGYLAIFGHGECYGGPGHCDLPPSRPRPFDLRGRHHNTPRNHRINVTACARRLLEQGAKSLTITLVVIGANYAEDRELLRLEGVSLNFLD
ncbi:MAG: tyrosinase family protein [Acidobacteriaceae bacterium]|nr:tyrosinase family protein [Acidobacteriaceae bacterium]